MIATPPSIKKHYTGQFVKYITENDYGFMSSLENVLANTWVMDITLFLKQQKMFYQKKIIGKLLIN